MKTRAPELRALIIIFGSAGPGDLDPPIVEVGRRRRDGPVGRADVGGRDREVRQDAGVELLLALLASLEKRDPLAPEPPLQVGDEGERLGGQDLVVRGDGAGDVDAGPALGCHPFMMAHRPLTATRLRAQTRGT